ncbi:MAG: S41 family peptidase [Gammaproteobacteria bacterium]|nr:S41 family peptidase [Gammaproteobacteria bacterium]
MKYPLALFLALIWSATVTAAPTAPAAAAPATGAPAPGKAAAATPESIPIDELRLLVEIFHKLKSDYVEELSDKTLLDSAIKGLVSGLDPHSSYLDEESYTELQEGTTGEFGGLGIEVGTEDGLLKVISPIDDTPASRAGVQAGDTIIKLDKTPLRGAGLNDAIKRMRGKVGSPISITLVREGVEKPIELTLIRAVIKIRSARGRLLEPGLGYIRLSMFQIHTGEDLVKQLAKLKADAKGPLKGLILDLRNNPGGVLGAAVAVADAFLDGGRIVYTEGRAADAKLEFNATGPDLLAGAPLIVLVNEGSASASEIVAGALQDHQRALIMGRQTFGKGSVQTILPMSNKAAIKITTARYFTPNGRSIQAEGIKPDVLIDKLTLAELDPEDGLFLKEAELERHLANPAKPTAAKPASTAATDAPMSRADRAALAKSDYEVFEALNLLKGMALLHAYGGPATQPLAAPAAGGAQQNN